MSRFTAKWLKLHTSARRVKNRGSEMGSTTISDLPNEILLSIFSYLPVFDLKYCIPAVCRKWNMLSKDSSIWKQITFVIKYNSFTNSMRQFLQTTPQLRDVAIYGSETEVHVILHILDRFCVNLRRLELVVSPSISKLLSSLESLPEQIEFLNLWFPQDVFPKSRNSTFCFLTNFTKLKEIHFNCDIPSRKDFELILENCPNLQHLNFGFNLISKSWFLMLLSRKDQFLSMYLRIDFLDQFCIKKLSTFSKLSKLGLVDNSASPERIFQIGQLHCLQNLQLSEQFRSPVLTSSTLHRFFRSSHFINLKKLNLFNSRMKDEVAVEIRRNCPALIYLEMSTYRGSPSILTKNALIQFLHCSKLQNIDIKFHDSDLRDWVYRRIRFVKHECNIDETCKLSLDELLVHWEEEIVEF